MSRDRIYAQGAQKPVELLHPVRRVFWRASLMTTGTQISVVLGPVDDAGEPSSTGVQAKVHRLRSMEEAKAVFARLVADARADGFIDPLELEPEPPRASVEERARLDAAIARLGAHVEAAGLELFGGQVRPAEPALARGPLARLTRCLIDSSIPKWELPKTYRALLEHYGELGVRTRHPRPRVLLRLLAADAVVNYTTDLESALVDHRPYQWPSDDLGAYGLDRCIVFALTEGWMEGWAFDTRVHADGEFAIRRIHDFSEDAGEMESAWPQESALGGERPRPFLDWLEEQANALLPGDVPPPKAATF